MPQLTAQNISDSDEWYRDRLRALQSIDEMVDQVFVKLDSYGILNNTYVFYSTDNGYHIGQHRLPLGKGCAIEEDIHIPLVVRGPRVAAGAVVDVPTTHTDLAPTFLDILGIPQRPDFDGAPIPLRAGSAVGISRAREHVQVEFWSDSNPSEDNARWLLLSHHQQRDLGTYFDQTNLPTTLTRHSGL